MRLNSNFVLIWNGTNASIPAGCSRDTSLDGKFIKGAESGNNAGGTGGSTTHTHTSSTHTHSITSHTHTISLNDASSGSIGLTGADYNFDLPTHRHTSDPSNGSTADLSTESYQINTESNYPEYYTVIFLNPGDGCGSIPIGVSVLSDGDIPSGYEVENLNTFICGANTSSDSGDTGGNSTHTHTVTSDHSLTSHSHGESTTNINTFSSRCAAGSGYFSISSHTHTVTLSEDLVDPSVSQDTQETSDNTTLEPNYKKLHLIKKNQGSSDAGIILMYKSTISSIPDEFMLCDGTNGTTDLVGKFIKLTSNTQELLDTGGYTSNHSHELADHTHDTSHAHNGEADIKTPDAGEVSNGNRVVPYNHVHTVNIGVKTATSTSSGGETTSSSDPRPPFAEVLFLKYMPDQNELVNMI